MAPLEALGVYTDRVDRRFGDMDKGFQDKLAEAMKWEDATLKKYLDKHRLAKWLQSTAETAEQEVRMIADEATRAGLGEGSTLVQSNGVAK